MSESQERRSFLKGIGKRLRATIESTDRAKFEVVSANVATPQAQHARCQQPGRQRKPDGWSKAHQDCFRCAFGEFNTAWIGATRYDKRIGVNQLAQGVSSFGCRGRRGFGCGGACGLGASGT